jgi:hypothetical protein
MMLQDNNSCPEAVLRQLFSTIRPERKRRQQSRFAEAARLLSQWAGSDIATDCERTF